MKKPSSTARVAPPAPISEPANPTGVVNRGPQPITKTGNRKRHRFLCTMEQPLAVGFHALHEQQQQVKALPIEPTTGDTEDTTILVAGAIRPVETLGSLASMLLLNKPTTDDCKAVILKPNLDPVRALLFPATAVNATILSGETLIGTVTRDDATKTTSAHTLTPESGSESNPLNVAIENILSAAKPKRNLASLVNAISDAADAISDGAGFGNIALIFDQTDDGSLLIYANGVAGTLTGKLADIQQDDAAPTAAAPSEW